MPIYLTDKGHNLVSVGLIVSLFILAGTFSGLLAGYMADKTDFKKIFFVSHAFMAPALLLYLYLPGPFVYLGSFIAGFSVLASLPLGVVMAQKLAPKSRAMVSSLMMGFAFSEEGGGMMAAAALYEAGVFAVWANNDPSVLQFLPPLVLSDDEADALMNRVRAALG